MKYIYIFPLLLLFLSESCVYHSIKVKQSFAVIDVNKKKNETQNLLNRFNLHLEDDKSYPSGNKLDASVFFDKFICELFSLSVTSKLNRIGVKYALNGKLNEAMIIFNEILSEDENDSATLNNIAVLCELMNDREKAFFYYSKACMAKPDNKFFIRNFILFCDNSEVRITSPFGKIITSKD